VSFWKARRVALAAVLAIGAGTVTSDAKGAPNQQAPNQSEVNRADPWADARHDMVAQQIRERGVRQPEVLRAMESVPRHLFIPAEHRDEAYGDAPLPIGWGQTISQPYIVALMTELLDLDSGDKVLEIGTGSGYHAAVLSRVAGEVYTIEIIDELGRQARSTLQDLGYQNVHVRIGDGYKGWPEEAPFDAIILTAAPPKIPQPLVDQLKVGGRMVVPVGSFVQDLLLLTRTPQGLEKRTVAPVRFVPMTGEVQKPGS
jgi:protein-L-isoaspartate(D-aspartate) O-methyltransferase